MLRVTHFTDPGCPWAYSASPAFATLRWRYGAQLEWRLVTIGLTEHAEQYLRRGYSPAGSARGYVTFRHRGMPFATEPRPRVTATGLACRAIVATRLHAPALEYEVFRALQFGWFTTPLVLDEPDGVAAALEAVDGLDVDAVLGALEDPAVEAAYQADRAEARTAEGSPTEFQGKAAQTDGPVRYTAPSLIFEHDGRQLEAGGFQPVEAYDVVVANLDPTLDRRPAAEDPLEVLEALPYALTTGEIAAAMTPHLGTPDPDAAETALIDHAADGRVIRRPLGSGALWLDAARSGRDRTATGRAPATHR